MDYTLVHYRAEHWEQHAYDRARNRLQQRGWPVTGLQFDPSLVSLGLVLDLELGNAIKANRFGYVLRAYHGTRRLDFEQQRSAYARTLVDLEEPRWVFLNTLFALSEATLFLQLVERLDAGQLDPTLDYAKLRALIRSALDAVHTEGELKQEIAAHPQRFVELDPELALTLQDLKAAGKQLLLITNSEWSYTQAMMSYAFDRYLPPSQRWRDLFELVVVSARKPLFFARDNPAFELVGEAGLLRPMAAKLRAGGAYLGGSAELVERSLGLSGEQILYIGDHIVADVRASKDLLRWRTGLVVRGLEEEIEATCAFASQQSELEELMTAKATLEARQAWTRVQLLRLEQQYAPAAQVSTRELKRSLQQLRAELSELDERIAPLAKAAGELRHPRWGLLLRAGNDKSHLARQLERSADVYMSRVSNLLHSTPFAYLRSPRSSLPHDG
jgi:HAD superfamily 5'-nucleotidase-like hydrolase